MSSRPYYFTWCNQPTGELFPVKRAEHDEFVLQDDRRVYDFVSTSFQTNFGHSCPEVREAIHAQLDAMPIASPKSSFELKQRVSQRLCDLIGLPGGKLFYTVGGSESVENALKMARQVTGRPKVLARRKSYHGSSLGALSVTGDWRNAPHRTVDEWTVRIPEPGDDPDLSATREIIAAAGPESVAACIVETVTGANGVTIPPQAWYDRLTELCRAHGILLILDEVLCGFGRTGPDFAFQAYDGLQPDLLCLSKAISGGFVPFGAVWTGPRVAKFYEEEKLACGLTSYAHPLGLAALGAVIDLMTDDAFRQNKAKLEAVFQEELEGIAAMAGVREIRSRGLLAAIDFLDEAPAWQAMFEAGLHAYSSGKMIVLCPPLVSKPSRLREAFAALKQVVRQHAGVVTA